ncbi:MAG: hypothetical protein ACD_23C00874G0002 [uncultured bacterium]|nr:MAG: hypothetical protein ACD_23C00874G0002 [uncultured bacterium]
MAAVYAAHQLLPCNRHVFRIARANEVMAFVGASTTMHAGIHKHLQRAISAKQVAHFGDSLVVPTIYQRTGKANSFLYRSRGRE